MIVQDYMTPNPLVVAESEPLARIAELIQQHRIFQVPVVDDSNRLVGIVTDRDLRSALCYDKHQMKSLGLLAEDIMTSDVVTVTPGENLKEAVHLLTLHHFGALPVVVGEQVVGILTSRDLLRRLMELLEDASASMGQGDVNGVAGVF